MRCHHVTVPMDPDDELRRILDELREPCEALLQLHDRLTEAMRDGNAVLVRRLMPQIETARYVASGLACGVAIRLAAYFTTRDRLTRRPDGSEN